MRTYSIKYTAKFAGTIDVRAESREEAKEIVAQSSYESTNAEEKGITDWNFDTTPVNISIS